MKALLVMALFLVAQVQALAAKETCYVATSIVSENIPTEFCFEDMGLYNDGDHEWLSIYGGNLAGEYEVTYEYLANNKYAYTAETRILVNPGYGCMAYEEAKLILSIPSDVSHNLNINKLSMSVEYFYSKDSCHLQPQITTIEYRLKK